MSEIPATPLDAEKSAAVLSQQKVVVTKLVVKNGLVRVLENIPRHICHLSTENGLSSIHRFRNRPS